MSKIALACDHAGYELMGTVREYLSTNGYRYDDFGTYSQESCDYPAVMLPAAQAVVSGACAKGIFICGTGIGISIAANKMHGIRAALCTNEFMAEMSRAHNDANVLVMGGRVTDRETAAAIVRRFLETGFSGEAKHRRRIEMIHNIEKE